MDVFERNELKSHIMSLATHTARATLFQDIALARYSEGKMDSARKYDESAKQERIYADRKQKFIWEWLDKL